MKKSIHLFAINGQHEIHKIAKGLLPTLGCHKPDCSLNWTRTERLPWLVVPIGICIEFLSQLPIPTPAIIENESLIAIRTYVSAPQALKTELPLISLPRLSDFTNWLSLRWRSTYKSAAATPISIINSNSMRYQTIRFWQHWLGNKLGFGRSSYRQQLASVYTYCVCCCCVCLT